MNSLEKQVISLLYRMHNEAKGKVTHNVMGNSEKDEIEGVFQGLSLMTWESFVQNRLPLLKLPDDILQALRIGQLAYTKAIALSIISLLHQLANSRRVITDNVVRQEDEEVIIPVFKRLRLNIESFYILFSGLFLCRTEVC